MKSLFCVISLFFALATSAAFATSATHTDSILSESGGSVSFPAGLSADGDITATGGLTAPTSGTNGNVLSGTASLTLTASTNVAAVVTPVTLKFLQVGNQVCAYGQVSIDPTSGSAATVFTLTLPVTRSANFSGTGGASGHAGILGAEVGSCLATDSAKTVTCNYVAGGTAVELVPTSFCYTISGD